MQQFWKKQKLTDDALEELLLQRKIEQKKGMEFFKAYSEANLLSDEEATRMMEKHLTPAKKQDIERKLSRLK